MRLTAIDYNVQVKYDNGEFITSFPITINGEGSTNDIVYAMTIAQYRLPRSIYKRTINTSINRDKKLIFITVSS